MAQIEIGLIDWARDRSGGTRSDNLIIAQTSAKFGLTDRLDIQLSATPYVRTRVRGAGSAMASRGFGDLELAAKYRLTNDDGALQIALRPSIKIPTGRRPLGNRAFEGGVILPVEYAISGSRLSLGMSPELDIAADENGSGHHLAMVQVIALSLAVSARVSTSVELSGTWDWESHMTGRQYALAGSVGYLVSDDVQIDGGIVVGLNRSTSDLELYSGIAFRF